MYLTSIENICINFNSEIVMLSILDIKNMYNINMCRF